MKQLYKSILIFSGGIAGGFILGGSAVIKFILNSDTLRPAIVNKIADEISTFLSEDKSKVNAPYQKLYTPQPRKNNEIVFATRGEAEDVLSSLVDIFNDYGIVTIEDLHSLSGILGRAGEENYGWDESNSILKASVITGKNGYYIVLPPSKVLN